jgi:hypothetical protein
MTKVTLTVPSVYEVNGVRLLPGVNNLNEDQLARLTRNKLVMADIEAGTLVVGSAETAETIEGSADPIDEAALIKAANGDARRKATQEARAALKAMGIDWQ